MSDLDSLLKTPLFVQHKNAGARIVDFGGWALPVNYSSQVDEHHAVRNDVGMFDVSHMTVSDISGEDTLAFLSKLLANDIQKATSLPGKAIYSCMLNQQGGVIDDLIAYCLEPNHCRIITNAATNEKDMAWLQEQAADFANVTVTEKPELALIAVQGPNAIAKVKATFPGHIAALVGGLKRFQGGFTGDIFAGRTGYTGEDGVEIIVPADHAEFIWTHLQDAGVQPCGLGARDTLRLEAGMALYGSDLSEEYTPLDCGLAWTVAMKDDRAFIGRPALESAVRYKMVGLKLEGKGVLRGHQSVLLNGETVGEITSGTFSPSLGYSIALARVNNLESIAEDAVLQVQIRQKQVDARVIAYPFMKK
ncbi:MAG: glycine cleavage system aminomethyltransferase GcvT [Pseudomonadota bacterium]